MADQRLMEQVYATSGVTPAPAASA
jgi:hypothetical protein